MKIKKNHIFQLIKVKISTDIDFSEEHKTLSDSNGYI